MEFQNNYPIYLQIADDIKRRIVIGELHPGDKLPSNTDLAVADASDVDEWLAYAEK